MTNQEIAEKLGSLAQLDVDAVHAYSQAIDEISIPDIREQLSAYRSDHDRHYMDLSAALRKIGAKPPEYSRSFKGFLIEGFTMVRSATGTEGALRAMEDNEQLTNRSYAEAATWDVPADIALLIRNNHRDEQVHLKYIQNALQNHVWEEKRQAVAR